MSIELLAVIISGSVSLLIALLTLGVNRYLTDRQLKHENRKLLYDIKSMTLPDLYKVRLSEYAALNQIIAHFSRNNVDRLTPEKAWELAEQINKWMYGSGGLIQGPRSRAYTWLLRDYCQRWKDGPAPKQLIIAKDYLQRELRNDLDVVTEGADSSGSLTRQLQAQIEDAVKNEKKQ